MALRFAGKHCAIVGATGTIGLRITKAFAQQGAVCSLLGRTAIEARSKLEPQLTPYAAPQLRSQADAQDTLPRSHQFIRLDISKKDSIRDVFTPREVRWTMALFLNLGPCFGKRAT